MDVPSAPWHRLNEAVQEQEEEIHRLTQERDWWRRLAIDLYDKINDRKESNADVPPRAFFLPQRSGPRPPATW